jgi:hypothetical protein
MRRGSRIAAVIGRTILVVLWLLAAVVVSAAGLELLLQARSHWRERLAAAIDAPNRHRLEGAYGPFTEMHLHPQYMFFFPRDPRARIAISNQTCSLDADGFRGPGPAHAGGRPLAFLLGGSAAFGVMASSDATTITGYLNRLQDTYFFVDAGVPGWNSTQEMYRLAFQILNYHPALIVTYDGANDAAFIRSFEGTAPDYSVGVPDGFEELSARVDTGGSTSPGRDMLFLGADLFPELKERLDKAFGRTAWLPDSWAAQRQPDSSEPLPESVLRAGVARYLSNLSRMRGLATAQGARFVAVFQPVAQLHRHLGPGSPLDGVPAIEPFHRTVVEQVPRDLEFHDLGDVFDQHYAAIPVVNPDVTDKTVFVDQVHLYDPGNEIIARHLAEFIR